MPAEPVDGSGQSKNNTGARLYVVVIARVWYPSDSAFVHLDPVAVDDDFPASFGQMEITSPRTTIEQHYEPAALATPDKGFTGRPNDETDGILIIVVWIPCREDPVDVPTPFVYVTRSQMGGIAEMGHPLP